MRTDFLGKAAVFVLCSSVICGVGPLQAGPMDRDGLAGSERVRQKAFESAQKLLQKARLSRENRNIDAAIEAYRRAIEADTSLVAAYLELGELYASTNAHDKAVETLDIGISMALLQEIVDPGIGRSCCILAKSHQALGRTDLASGDLVKAMKYLPDDPLPHIVLGDIQTDRKRYEEAFAAYRRAIGIDRSNADAWWALGSAAVRANRPDVAREAHDGLEPLDPVRAATLAKLIGPSGAGREPAQP
ncbi:MAG TPA: tetratricopeptide repeat protein [Candidatus Ozemobacteraceae bacterium]|nr:tetratricopeptide repeat protein [Candidatus Ozemobacteraceae bacterium]